MTHSVFSPFAEQLLIPQLKEAATLYDLDGAWMDADGWVARLDYSPAALRWEPEGPKVEWTWNDGLLTAAVPSLQIHGVLVVE